MAGVASPAGLRQHRAATLRAKARAGGNGCTAAGADRRHGCGTVCAAAVVAAARMISEQSLQESHGVFLRTARMRRCSRSKAHWDTAAVRRARSEEHTSELQSQSNLVCRLLLEKKN